MQTLVVAEAGSNHNGNIKQAFKLVDAACDAGAQVVKFQTYSSETLYCKNTPDFAGHTNVNELIKETPVNQLGKFLEKAYWLAVKDSFVDQGSSLDITSIGGLTASSGKTDTSHGLSDRETKVAQNLGMSPEDYAKNKKKIKDSGLWTSKA